MEDKMNDNVIQKKKKKSPVFPIILAVLVIAGGIWGYRIWQHSLHHVDTDDAQIASHMSPVISKVSGYIAAVKVQDNQMVHQGDTLIILDNKDQLMTLRQAEAALGTARANILSARAGAQAAKQSIVSSRAAVRTSSAQIEAAKVNVWRTSEDLKRYENLIQDHSITRQQYEQALAAKQTADRQLEILMEQKNQASSQTGVVSAQSNATSQQIGITSAITKQREVDVETARLNLSYTVITAPTDGYVSKVPVQPGQFLQAGAQLFNIVADNSKWVIANFKETQLTKMLEGQKADIMIDAFPKHPFHGVISSISPATGSTFSLLPPDNASGNFVKVVQRVPVKIDFLDTKDPLLEKLRTGMNVKVEVQLDQIN